MSFDAVAGRSWEIGQASSRVKTTRKSAARPSKPRLLSVERLSRPKRSQSLDKPETNRGPDSVARGRAQPTSAELLRCVLDDAPGFSQLPKFRAVRKVYGHASPLGR